MNWKLIILLSLFGLAMGIATVFLIPSKTEPLFWLAIFIICAFIIARQAPGKYFLHGFTVSLVNCVWITAAHILFYNNYITNHPDMTSMSRNLPLQEHPRLMMLLTGPIVGIVSGLVLGLFAYIASRMVHRKLSVVKENYRS